MREELDLVIEGPGERSRSRPAAILGNGPSLRGFDFRNQLKGFTTFGMNAAYRYWDQIHWYPDYYACLDEVVGLSHQGEIKRLIERAPEFGIAQFLLRSNLVGALRGIRNADRIVDFDACRGGHPALNGARITTGSQTTAWAVSLGHMEVALLGIDSNYVEFVPGAERVGGTVLEIREERENPNYFFDGYQRKGDRYQIPNIEPTQPTHRACWHEIAAPLETSGAIVVNANPQSKVDVFPVCRFENVRERFRKERELRELVRMQQARLRLYDLPEYPRETRASMDEIGLIAALLGDRPDGVMVDVGAHHGGACDRFLDLDWRVVAFEPDPSNRIQMEAVVGSSPRLVIDERAVSNVGGRRVPLYASSESHGISSLIAFTSKHHERCQVETVTLRDACAEYGISKIDFLKIDVEGYDRLVLDGFPWGSVEVDIIMAEFDDAKTLHLGTDFHDLVSAIHSHGYYIYFSEWHETVRYGVRHDWRRFRPFPHIPGPKAWGNIIAFRERPDEALLGEVVGRSITATATAPGRTVVRQPNVSTPSQPTNRARRSDSQLFIVTSFFTVRPIAGAVTPGSARDLSSFSVSPQHIDPAVANDRQQEYIECLVRNAECTHAAGVIVVVQDLPAMELLRTQVLALLTHAARSRLVPILFSRQPRQPTYSDLFAVANEFSPALPSQAMFMVCNSDIFIGEDFDLNRVKELLLPGTSGDRRAAPRRTALALTRYETTAEMGTPMVDDYQGSHDAFIVVPPLPESFLASIDHPQNCYKAENVVVHELRAKCALEVLNPCRSVRVYHRHTSGVRQWLPPVDQKRYGQAVPQD